MGFNASAGMTIHQSAVISTTAVVNTYLAGSSAAVVTLILQRFLPYWGCYWSFIAMAKGCVCGMVTFTSHICLSDRIFTRKMGPL